jgi:amino acid permease
MFAILNEIKDNSHRSTLSVVSTSVGGGAVIYLLVGITGYLSFGDHIGGNIIAQYVPSWAATIGRAAIVVLVMFSYPLQVHPCRASTDNVLNWRPRRTRGPTLPNGRPVEMSDVKFAVVSTLVIVGTYLVAMAVGSLEKVLAYVGSTGSTTISL